MHRYTLFVLLLCSLEIIIVFCNHTVVQDTCDISDIFFGAEIFLFFASANGRVRENIAIYFFNPNFELGDKVILTIKNKTNGEWSTYSHSPISKKGIYYTNVNLPNVSYIGHSTFKQECLGIEHRAYWARGDIKSKHVCLSSHPDWMHQMKEIIKSRKLSSLIIPGTDRSGAYGSKTTRRGYKPAQNMTVLEQLLAGVRYIDIRPGVNGLYYWNVHDQSCTHYIANILNDVKKFINNTKEIVILGFSEFSNGFQNTHDHYDFIRYLERKIGQYLLPRTPKLWDITLKDIWQSNKRIIISYDHEIYNNTPTVWPSISRFQANLRFSNNLKEGLVSAESQPIKPKVTVIVATWSSQATIKLAFSHAIANPSRRSGIHLDLALSGNITEWYNELFHQTASIVAVDYIETTGIIEIAIEWNKRRSSSCYFDYICQMRN